MCWGNLTSRLSFAHRQTERSLHQSASSRLVLMPFQLVGRHAGQLQSTRLLSVKRVGKNRIRVALDGADVGA